MYIQPSKFCIGTGLSDLNIDSDKLSSLMIQLGIGILSHTFLTLVLERLTLLGSNSLHDILLIL